MNPAELNIFTSRLDAVCDEMGLVLRNSAFSPNIRDRLDFSCAIFDAQGDLCAQAAHIPVHLGSMAFAMRQVIGMVDWQAGDQVVFNDPFLGGTHLPDVTLVAPLFVGQRLQAFVVNRAHHADIGAGSPGSMPVSRSLHEEGLVLAPVHLQRNGQLQQTLVERLRKATRNPQESLGDFTAQLAANRAGLASLERLHAQYGEQVFADGVAELNAYAERLALAALAQIPNGEYRYCDYLDDDGQGRNDIPIRVRLQVADGRVSVDFAGTAEQVAGNVNCPLAVAAAAVYYVFRCLMPPQTPSCAGAFRPIQMLASPGSLVNADRPAAVAAGNVETSTRIVDVLLGALAGALPERIPAASHGSMNNLAMGHAGVNPWDYYETIGGGMGGHARAAGLNGVQTHMTNTLNTPLEVLESRYPLRLRRYAYRRGSGGAGLHRGGDGLVREFEFLAPAHLTLLTERRRHSPWGLLGGAPGLVGVNRLNGMELAGKCALDVQPGDRLSVETPGGGGWRAAGTE